MPRPRPAALAAFVLPAFVLAVICALTVLTGPAARSSTVSTALSTELSTGSASSVGIAAGSAAAIQPVSRTSPDSGGSSGGSGSSPGGAAPSTNPSIEVILTKVETPAGGSTALRVAGTVLVSGANQPTNLSVSLDVGSPLTSRDTLRQLDQGATVRSITWERVLADEPLLTPGGAMTGRQFIVGTDAARFVPTELTVRPVRVRVLGRVNGQAASTQLATATTYMVLTGGARVAAPTSVLTIVPLATAPRLRSDGIFTDNTLRDEIRPGGRLANLLEPVVDAVTGASASAAKVALAVDPTLVQALWLMEKQYFYATPGGQREATADPNASGLLETIKAFADRGGKVFALPFGDIDLPATVRADQLDALQYATNTGQLVIAQLLDLGAQRTDTVAYPADGIADAPTVNALSANGAGTVIVDDRLLPAVPSVRYTPSAAVTLPTASGQIRALAADNVLRDLVTDYDGAEMGHDLALARFRAELAMITDEGSQSRDGRPQSRLAVLTLRRDASPSPGWLPDILGSLDGTYAVGVDWATATSAAPDGTRQRAGLTYNPAAQQLELPVDLVDRVEEIRDKALVLGSLFCPPTELAGAELVTCRRERIDPLVNTLVTGLSAAWRTQRESGVSLVQQADGSVQELQSSVRVVSSRMVNLTSSRGRVPVTLENSSGWGVTVVLKLSSTDRARLISATTVTRTLEPRQKEQIEIDVDAESAGTFPVDIRLETVDGRLIGPEASARVLVRSTVYGAIATAITVGAVGVLFAAVLIRLLRRLRARSRQSPPGSTPDGHPNGHPNGHPREPSGVPAAAPGVPSNLSDTAGVPGVPGVSDAPDVSDAPGGPTAARDVPDRATMPLRHHVPVAPERMPYPPSDRTSSPYSQPDRIPHHPAGPGRGHGLPRAEGYPATPAGSRSQPQRQEGR